MLRKSKSIFRRLRNAILCTSLLGIVVIGICPAQELAHQTHQDANKDGNQPQNEAAPKKPQKIDVQILVTDSKDGTPIDNVQVQLKWSDGDSGTQKAVTNGNGIAKLKDVPQETVTIRLIAGGYKTIAPSFNLKTEKQPIKLSLDKETPHIAL